METKVEEIKNINEENYEKVAMLEQIFFEAYRELKEIEEMAKTLDNINDMNWHESIKLGEKREEIYEDQLSFKKKFKN